MKKNETWINELLLQQAGELPLWRRFRLWWLWRRNPVLRAEFESFLQVQSLVSNAELDTAMSDASRQRIRDVAHQHMPPQSIRPVWNWQPAWGYAMAVVAVLLASVWLMQNREQPTEWVKQPQEQRRVEWVPVEWDAIFMELVLDTRDQLHQLREDLEDATLGIMEESEEEWARELLEMGKTI